MTLARHICTGAGAGSRFSRLDQRKLPARDMDTGATAAACYVAPEPPVQVAIHQPRFWARELHLTFVSQVRSSASAPSASSPLYS